MAIILYPDGKQEQTSPANGNDFSLDELHSIVQGHIEVIPTRDNRLMVINDTGRLDGLPRNEQATALAKLTTAEERANLKSALADSGIDFVDLNPPGEDDYVAGTVLVCERWEVE